MKVNVFAFKLTDKTPWITCPRTEESATNATFGTVGYDGYRSTFIDLSLDRRIGKHLCSLFGVTLFYWIVHFLKQRIALDVQINASSIERFAS